jgi:hypothetical protein
MLKLALPILALLLTTGCSGNPAVGNWTTDAAATLASLDLAMQESMKAMPAEARAGMKDMMAKQIGEMKITMELKADGKVAMHADMPGGKHEHGAGTWTLAGDQLTIATKMEGQEKTETKTGTLKGNTFEMQQEAGPVKMTLVFKRK